MQPEINVFEDVSIIALQLLRESYIVLPLSTFIDVKLEQPAKAQSPMLVTLLGMVTEVRPGDGGKAGTIRESVLPNTRHAIRNVDAGKAGTIRESVPPNTRHAIRNVDAGKAATGTESAPLNTRHAIRNVDAGKP